MHPFTTKSSMRDSVKAVLRPVKRWTRSFITASFPSDHLTVWVGKGEERAGGQRFCVAYAGIERHKNYFFQSAFREGYEEFPLKKVRAQELMREITAGFPGCSACFFEVRPFRTKPLPLPEPTFFKIPLWVRLELDLRGAWEDFHHSKRFSNLKRSWKRQAVEYEMVEDEKKFSDFYHQIYVPFTRKKHGASAFIYSYEDARNKFRAGELLLAKEDGVPIAGVILEYSLIRCIPSCIGVREDKTERIRQGLMSAIWYQIILRSKERNFEKIDFGYSRSYLKDGAFRFKARLGAYVTPDFHRSSGYLTVKVLDWSLALKSSFIANPFLSLTESEKFQAVLFVEKASHIDASLMDSVTRDVLCEGLDSLTIYAFESGFPAGPVAGEYEGLKDIRKISAYELM